MSAMLALVLAGGLAGLLVVDATSPALGSQLGTERSYEKAVPADGDTLPASAILEGRQRPQPGADVRVVIRLRRDSGEDAVLAMWTSPDGADCVGWAYVQEGLLAICSNDQTKPQAGLVAVKTAGGGPKVGAAADDDLTFGIAPRDTTTVVIQSASGSQRAQGIVDVPAARGGVVFAAALDGAGPTDYEAKDRAGESQGRITRD